MLAYIPFLDPIPLHDYWLVLIVPLGFAIALTYKTLRLPTLDRLFVRSLRLTIVGLVSLVAASAVLWGLSVLL